MATIQTAKWTLVLQCQKEYSPHLKMCNESSSIYIQSDQTVKRKKKRIQKGTHKHNKKEQKRDKITWVSVAATITTAKAVTIKL